MSVEAAEEGPSDGLRRLIKTDPDPRVRQRAQAVLLVEQGHSLASELERRGAPTATGRAH